MSVRFFIITNLVRTLCITLYVYIWRSKFTREQVAQDSLWGIMIEIRSLLYSNILLDRESLIMRSANFAESSKLYPIIHP